MITLICLFLFIGAMGKSAQFLLHTWLPDAMEGITPVSALIHTYNNAGVFLVVKCSPLFEYSQVALNVVTIIDDYCNFALCNFSSKRYKNCILNSSQLGYMFLQQVLELIILQFSLLLMLF